MRVLLGNLFRRISFKNTLQRPAKVDQCWPLFVEAVQSHFKGEHDRFELLKEETREIKAKPTG